MLLQLSHFFTLYSPLPCTHPPTTIPPPKFMSMSHSYKFFGFSISYIILTSPCLFCTYHLCFPVPFTPFYPLLVPADSPPCDLHFCDSVPVLVVSFSRSCFCFGVFLGSVIDSCEFVVILLFIVLIFFFFLDKNL